MRRLKKEIKEWNKITTKWLNDKITTTTNLRSVIVFVAVRKTVSNFWLNVDERQTFFLDYCDQINHTNRKRKQKRKRREWLCEVWKWKYPLKRMTGMGNRVRTREKRATLKSSSSRFWSFMGSTFISSNSSMNYSIRN